MNPIIMTNALKQSAARQINLHSRVSSYKLLYYIVSVDGPKPSPFRKDQDSLCGSGSAILHHLKAPLSHGERPLD